MDISELIEDYTLPKWEDYPGIEGFKVLIRLPDVPKSFSLAARAWREEQKEIGEVDSENISDIGPHMARYAVTDWRGLTVAGLRQLASDRKIGGADNQEIPFSAENLKRLLSISGGFFLWVLSIVRDRQKAAQEEAQEVKNL